MPTGYTEPILKGKITEFKDYAKLCMRAFGATIHMKDDYLDVEYEPRVPEKFYHEKIIELKSELDMLIKMSDEEILDKRQTEIKNDIKYHEEKLIETKENEEKLLKMLKSATTWEPPTDEHSGIKKFMIEQITETLKYDADSKWYVLEIKRLNELLTNINLSKVKEHYSKKLNKDIQYYIERGELEIKRVKESNKWVEQLLKSL